MTPEQVEAIVSIITRIKMFKNHMSNMNCFWRKSVQDADRLDAIGAIGVARVMCYSVQGRPTNNPDMNMWKYDTWRISKQWIDINHALLWKLVKKILMNTSHGNELVKGRHEFLEIYLEQFIEWDGKW